MGSRGRRRVPRAGHCLDFPAASRPRSRPRGVRGGGRGSGEAAGGPRGGGGGGRGGQRPRKVGPGWLSGGAARAPWLCWEGGGTGGGEGAPLPPSTSSRPQKFARVLREQPRDPRRGWGAREAPAERLATYPRPLRLSAAAEQARKSKEALKLLRATTAAESTIERWLTREGRRRCLATPRARPGHASASPRSQWHTMEGKLGHAHAPSSLPTLGFPRPPLCVQTQKTRRRRGRRASGGFPLARFCLLPCLPGSQGGSARSGSTANGPARAAPTVKNRREVRPTVSLIWFQP